MKTSMRIAAVAVLLLAHASLNAAEPGGLFLASGPIAVCSSLSPAQCAEAPAAAQGVTPPRYGVDAAGIGRVQDPMLWSDSPASMPQTVGRLLGALQASGPEDGIDGEDLRARLAALCLVDEAVAPCSDPDARRPWLDLLDAEQYSVLAGLELPQLAADGQRPPVVAWPADSRPTAGFALIQGFVRRVSKDTETPPRIVFVTAAAEDPYAAAEATDALLRVAGAEPVWWPIDAALRVALFEAKDCSALPALRLQRLRLPQRERIHPERTARQAQACAAYDATARIPDGADALLFADGDALRLRQAMFHPDGQPTPWLRSVRAAFAASRLAVGGIGGGAAALSDAPLATRGKAALALLRGASATQPPAPGCGRARRCPDAGGETLLHVETAGGLGLATNMVVEVQTAELARELRLLRLLQIGPARIALGVDAESAFWLGQDSDGAWRIEALGAQGGWILHAGSRDARCRIPGLFSVIGERLEPGRHARVGVDLPPVLEPSQAPPRRPIPAGLRLPTLPGALRDAARGLATVSDHQTLRGRVRGGKQVVDVSLDRVSGQTWLRVAAARTVPAFCPGPLAAARQP